MNNASIWAISLLTFITIIVRPFKINEAIWALIGACALLIFGLVLPSEALKGILSGTDVYLFLTGMMLLAETARKAKLFDWLAMVAIKASRGSSRRLFLLIYLAAVLVTIFLSNDATAVVLTPAVAAAIRKANIKKPLPYVLICAFVANAASFTLPISNPANLVIYQGHLPSLEKWMSQYWLSSLVAVTFTFFLLKFTQKEDLEQQPFVENIKPKLSKRAKISLAGIMASSVVLLVCSALEIQLGLPTFIIGIIISVAVNLYSPVKMVSVVKGISWSILPLVACLFIIVEALAKTGLIENISSFLQSELSTSETKAVWISGLTSGYGANLLNNLPSALILADVAAFNHFPEIIRRAILIGTDLGPNLSVTGSLATILWLAVLRRERIKVSSLQFLKLGIIVMSVALIAAIGSLFIV